MSPSVGTVLLMAATTALGGSGDGTVGTMNRMKIDTSTDDYGALRIQIPGRPSRYHVHVTVEWEESATEASSGWSPGWIEKTAGSITDPTFVRHPPGEYEKREELE